MPFDEGLGLDDDQSVLPIKKSSQGKQRQPNRSWSSARLRLAFLEERQLFAQEKILGDQGRAGKEK
jgi:hypothetical protein